MSKAPVREDRGLSFPTIPLPGERQARLDARFL